MTSITVDFGFYPDRLDVTCGAISISTLAGFDTAVSDTLGSAQLVAGWYYAPPAAIIDMMAAG